MQKNPNYSGWHQKRSPLRNKLHKLKVFQKNPKKDTWTDGRKEKYGKERKRRGNDGKICRKKRKKNKDFKSSPEWLVWGNKQ